MTIRDALIQILVFGIGADTFFNVLVSVSVSWPIPGTDTLKCGNSAII